MTKTDIENMVFDMTGRPGITLDDASIAVVVIVDDTNPHNPEIVQSYLEACGAVGIEYRVHGARELLFAVRWWRRAACALAAAVVVLACVAFAGWVL